MVGRSVSLAGLADLWKKTTGDPDICIAVLDGPVDAAHPCLREANLTIAPTQSSSSGAAALRHGTMVASILFGAHDSLVPGIAPGCRGLVVPIFEEDPSGEIRPCSQLDMARAIDQAIQGGANVINISAGEMKESGALDGHLARSLNACRERGVLVVAATGNDGCDCLHLPASHAEVLAVGAMDAEGSPLSWSNWSQRYGRRGLLAPGVDIPAALPGGETMLCSGTSFATAIVAGVAALLLSLQARAAGRPDVDAVRAALLDSAIGCRDPAEPDCDRLLAGRLNLPGAEALVEKGAVKQMSEQTSTTSEETLVGAVAAEPTIRPSECGCQQKASVGEGAPPGPQVVYALGRLGYDFGSETRRDSFHQQMGLDKNPYAPADILAHLEKNPSDAADLIWTLNIDSTPIYAILPKGPFAELAYERLRTFLAEQSGEGVERISLPGLVIGQHVLLNGQTVPTVQPAVRGLWNWTVEALVQAATGKPLPKNATEKDKAAQRQRNEALSNFLRRVYDELRNLGVTSRDRALNFYATNALVAAKVFESVVSLGMELDSISVEPSLVSRPGSDSWDVRLTFFDPAHLLERARRTFAATVDVSDLVPVMIGDLRSWSIR